jgi:VIT1/CCC1 family predicted Fe2+/Mn2+ transporter
MKRNAWAPITPALATSASAGASVAIAILWAAVILAVSSTLSGSPLERQVLTLVGGGVAGTIIVLGGWLRRSA